MDRRVLLQSGLLFAAAAATRVRAAEPIHFKRNPFTLGVASGYPTPDGFVLWTRLAPQPLAPNGGMDPVIVPVVWEIAGDAAMRNVVRRGTAYASPDWAHSIHVEPNGLQPARSYWYRFTAGEVQSQIGRTWTAPAAGTSLTKLRLGIASCQHYEHGYYTALRQMANDSLDLIVHVGDYIYESNFGVNRVRSHDAHEAYTLDDYRTRYALYRTDANLQAAHAACPWMLTWDDHEVNNDYAGAVSQQDDDPALFLARRAAAYRAYYEHLPLPRQAVPFNADMHLYMQLSFGDLLNLYMLDERQYRTPQACPAPGRRGGNRVSNCAEREEASRTMLGARQEAWLDAQLGDSKVRWNVLAQGVLMAHLDEQPGPGRRYWTDSWNGYPAARQRLVQSLSDKHVSNPIILGGDIHAFVASDLNLVPERLDTPVVASELVTTSISSEPMEEQYFKTVLPENPNILAATGLYRGYVRLELSDKRAQADLVAMETVRETHSGARVLRSFVIEEGRKGLQSA